MNCRLLAHNKSADPLKFKKSALFLEKRGFFICRDRQSPSIPVFRLIPRKSRAGGLRCAPARPGCCPRAFAGCGSQI